MIFLMFSNLKSSFLVGLSPDHGFNVAISQILSRIENKGE